MDRGDLNMEKNKKGMELGGILPAVMTLIFVTIVIGVGLVILGQFGTTTGVRGTASEAAINSSITAIATIPNNWMTIIVLIVVFSIIIALLVGAFMYFGRKGR
jgi:NADH:ubiquinone oxidoreductase subunit 3 (subunit A)